MKHFNHKMLLALALSVATLGIKAQNAASTGDTLRLSADDCVKIALSTNPTIKVADMEITRVSYSKNLTIAQLLPAVSFSGQFSRALADLFYPINSLTCFLVVLLELPIVSSSIASEIISISSALVSSFKLVIVIS